MPAWTRWKCCTSEASAGRGRRRGCAPGLRAKQLAPVAVLILGVNPRRPLDADYRAFFRLVAHHVALALTNAAAHEAGRARARELEEIALTLQRSLLPRGLPEVPGVELRDGRIVIAIGDVAGHGVLAAAVMGQLRNALRAYALEGHMPAVVTASLDRLVLDAELTMTTCLCGVF